MLLKESSKVREEEGEDVSTLSADFKERENTGNWNRKHQISLCGELAVEEAVDCRKEVCGMNESHQNFPFCGPDYPGIRAAISWVTEGPVYFRVTVFIYPFQFSPRSNIVTFCWI